MALNLGRKPHLLKIGAVVFPENHAALFYLGLIHPEQGSRAGAIAHWQQCLEVAPQSEPSLTILKNLTKLNKQHGRTLNPIEITRYPGGYQLLIISSTTVSMFGGL